MVCHYTAQLLVLLECLNASLRADASTFALYWRSNASADALLTAANAKLRVPLHISTRYASMPTAAEADVALVAASLPCHVLEMYPPSVPFAVTNTTIQRTLACGLTLAQAAALICALRHEVWLLKPWCSTVPTPHVPSLVHNMARQAGYSRPQAIEWMQRSHDRHKLRNARADEQHAADGLASLESQTQSEMGMFADSSRQAEGAGNAPLQPNAPPSGSVSVPFPTVSSAAAVLERDIQVEINPSAPPFAWAPAFMPGLLLQPLLGSADNSVPCIVPSLGLSLRTQRWLVGYLALLQPDAANSSLSTLDPAPRVLSKEDYEAAPSAGAAADASSAAPLPPTATRAGAQQGASATSSGVVRQGWMHTVRSMARRAVETATFLWHAPHLPSPVFGRDYLRAELVAVLDGQQTWVRGASLNWIDTMYLSADCHAALHAWKLGFTTTVGSGAAAAPTTVPPDAIDAAMAAAVTEWWQQADAPVNTSVVRALKLSAFTPRMSALRRNVQWALDAGTHAQLALRSVSARWSTPHAQDASAPSGSSGGGGASSPSHRPLVLLCNPNAGIYEYMLYSAHWLSLYTRLGCDVLTFNYRGYARSTGTPGPSLLREDAVCLMRAAEQLYGRRECVIVHGESIGGLVAAGLAHRANVSPLRVALMDRTFESLMLMAQEMLAPALGPHIGKRLLRLVTRWTRRNSTPLLSSSSRTLKFIAVDANDPIIPFAASLPTGIAQSYLPSLLTVLATAQPGDSPSVLHARAQQHYLANRRCTGWRAVIPRALRRLSSAHVAPPGAAVARFTSLAARTYFLYLELLGNGMPLMTQWVRTMLPVSQPSLGTQVMQALRDFEIQFAATSATTPRESSAHAAMRLFQRVGWNLPSASVTADRAVRWAHTRGRLFPLAAVNVALNRLEMTESNTLSSGATTFFAGSNSELAVTAARSRDSSVISAWCHETAAAASASVPPFVVLAAASALMMAGLSNGLGFRMGQLSRNSPTGIAQFLAPALLWGWRAQSGGGVTPLLPPPSAHGATPITPQVTQPVPTATSASQSDASPPEQPAFAMGGDALGQMLREPGIVTLQRRLRTVAQALAPACIASSVNPSVNQRVQAAVNELVLVCDELVQLHHTVASAWSVDALLAGSHMPASPSAADAASIASLITSSAQKAALWEASTPCGVAVPLSCSHNEPWLPEEEIVITRLLEPILRTSPC